MGWLQVVHPEDLAMATTAFRKSAPDVSVNELRVRAADGVYRWFVCRTRTLRDANGQVVRRFGVATDIDDLKRVQQELQHSNARLGAIIDSISDCYYTIDRDWRFTGMNAKAAEWLGVSAAEMIGRPYEFDASRPQPVPLHPPGHGHRRAGARRSGIDGAARPLGQRAYLSLRRRRERLLPRHQRDGSAPSGRNASAMRCCNRRSMRCRRMSRSSTATERSSRSMRRGADFAVANGYRGDNHGVGANYLLICDAALGVSTETAAVASGLRAALEGGEMLRIEYPCASTNSSRWFQLRATRFGSGDQTRIVLAHEDVTEVKRAEHELRRLAGRLLVLQDEERRRIARELHDSTAQNLVALGFNLDRLERRAPVDEDVRSTIIADSRALIDRSLKELRTLSYLLHPPVLDDAGLVPAIRSFIDGFSRRSGIKVEMKLPGRMARLPRDAESAIFRVVQEALANVHRHSGSATAAVRLSRSRERVVLEIVDRGAGIAGDDEGFAGGRCAFARGRDPRDASPAAPAQRRSRNPVRGRSGHHHPRRRPRRLSAAFPPS